MLGIISYTLSELSNQFPNYIGVMGSVNVLCSASVYFLAECNMCTYFGMA